MEAMTITTFEKDFRVHSRFNHAGRAPFAGDHGVIAQMPEEIIVEILRTALDLPLAQNVKTFRIEDKNPARSFSSSRSEGTYKNAVRATVDGVRTAVTGARRQYFRFNDLDDLRVARIRLGVNDVDSRRANAGDDQVTPLGMRMRREWTEA